MEQRSADADMGRRERTKRETRGRLGDVAARLFAARGYDEVSMSDLARAAGVSDQTVYNYFPTKPDLVLDRAEEVLERIRAAVASRAVQQSPADAIRRVVLEDIDRYVSDDPDLAKGQFPAQCRLSVALRRRALEFYDDVTTAVADELPDTYSDAMTRRAQAAALVAVIQQTTTAIGSAVLDDADRHETRELLANAATAALDNLSHWWTDEPMRWLSQGS
ncbi:TetR/AcrR family transcriptional regulator [Curtobacterium sp. MCBA15_008]|uniref:TetR/AcrR family transcriptional regulator n=1 Tax=Curtobacterium sp. MCBA15_008 TaxID=1898736 RepID=UPI0008DCB7E3|nr:TetR/AcrR family transcriptional regulator [Curtobacterium sp. MCBA15_008]OII13225.1 hypothetical protein BIU96_14745 [Curtobacterium sp. MCBA15_008]